MAVPEVVVEGVVFPPVARPPGSAVSHFLGGAGMRGLEIGGNFIKFTAIGVYLEDAAVSALAKKCAGKTADELASDAAFFRDVVMGDFEKFTRVTMILPLTGEQYAEKLTENCVALWKAVGLYTDAEGVAVEKFKEVFKPETFPPGTSILFTHSLSGVLTVAFSKDSSVPAAGGVAIENKHLCEVRGRAGVHHRGARRLAGREAEPRGEGVGAPDQGYRRNRRRAAGGARLGHRLSERSSEPRGEREPIKPRLAAPNRCRAGASVAPRLVCPCCGVVFRPFWSHVVCRSLLVASRDENDRKRSIGGQITFVFTFFFSRKRNRYDIVGNEYDTDIPVISKTIVVDRKIYR